MKNTKRLDFDEIRSRTILEADRAQIATQNYINQLEVRIVEINAKSDRLFKKAGILKAEAADLLKMAFAARKEADEAYKKTFSTIMESFNVKPPFSASIAFSEDGAPLGIDLQIDPG